MKKTLSIVCSVWIVPSIADATQNAAAVKRVCPVYLFKACAAQQGRFTVQRIPHFPRFSPYFSWNQLNTIAFVVRFCFVERLPHNFNWFKSEHFFCGSHQFFFENQNQCSARSVVEGLPCSCNVRILSDYYIVGISSFSYQTCSGKSHTRKTGFLYFGSDWFSCLQHAGFCIGGGDLAGGRFCKNRTKFGSLFYPPFLGFGRVPTLEQGIFYIPKMIVAPLCTG